MGRRDAEGIWDGTDSKMSKNPNKAGSGARGTCHKGKKFIPAGAGAFREAEGSPDETGAYISPEFIGIAKLLRGESVEKLLESMVFHVSQGESPLRWPLESVDAPKSVVQMFTLLKASGVAAETLGAMAADLYLGSFVMEDPDKYKHLGELAASVGNKDLRFQTRFFSEELRRVSRLNMYAGPTDGSYLEALANFRQGVRVVPHDLAQLINKTTSGGLSDLYRNPIQAHLYLHVMDPRNHHDPKTGILNIKTPIQECIKHLTPISQTFPSGEPDVYLCRGFSFRERMDNHWMPALSDELPQFAREWKKMGKNPYSLAMAMILDDWDHDDLREVLQIGRFKKSEREAAIEQAHKDYLAEASQVIQDAQKCVREYKKANPL